MESERSILLQKKMVLALSLIIITVFSSIYVENKKTVKTYENANLEEITEVINIGKQEQVTENQNFKLVRNKYLMASLIDSNIVNNTLQDEIAHGASENEIKNENSVAEEVLEANAILQDSGAEKEAEEFVLFSDFEVVNVKTSMLKELPSTDVKSVGTTEKDSSTGLEEIVISEMPEGEAIVVAEETPNSGEEKKQNYKEVIEVTATAYCLCQKCCGKTPDNPNYGRTASGLRIVPGTGMKVIAVDPTVIPLNSHVYVEGMNGAWDYGYAIAADTGGAIKNNKIDLYMDSHSEALKWGRRNVRVYVLEDEA